MRPNCLDRLSASTEKRDHSASRAVSPDHIHMLLSAPPILSSAKLAHYIEGRTSRHLQVEFPELRKRYWGQHMWARSTRPRSKPILKTRSGIKTIRDSRYHSAHRALSRLSAGTRFRRLQPHTSIFSRVAFYRLEAGSVSNSVFCQEYFHSD